MRIWISGPRIFGGLIRPGIGFSLPRWRSASGRRPRRFLLPPSRKGFRISAGWFVAAFFAAWYALYIWHQATCGYYCG